MEHFSEIFLKWFNFNSMKINNGNSYILFSGNDVVYPNINDVVYPNIIMTSHLKTRINYQA